MIPICGIILQQNSWLSRIVCEFLAVNQIMILSSRRVAVSVRPVRGRRVSYPGGLRMAETLSNPCKIVFGATEELAETLVEVRQLRRERLLEMEHLDPRWLVSIYIRAIAFSAAMGWRTQRSNS